MRLSKDPGTRRAAAALAGGALIAIGGSLLPDFLQLQATSWAIFGMLALSLTLVWGGGGIFSFGQGAFFGVGAYAYGVVAMNLLPHTNESLSAVVAAALAGALVAAAIGYFMFYGKVGDVYVGIITLALTLVLYTVVSGTADPRYHIGVAAIGGYNGMSGVPPLTIGWPGAAQSIALSIEQQFVAVVLVAALCLAGVYWLQRRPFGRVLEALRDNELRAQLLGYDVRARKLLAFALGGALAGLAGALYAAWGMFVSPGVFGLQQASIIVIWALIGGRRSALGAFVGALLVSSLSFVLGGDAGNYTPIILGAVLIAVVLFVPQGIVPSLHGLLGGLRGRAGAQPAPGAASAQPAGAPRALPPRSAAGGRAPELQAIGLAKSFGGVQAVRDASLRFASQGVHCLIGPNGAGKSTFFNLLVGRHFPSGGDIRLDGRSIRRAEPHARVRAGLGIKLQEASVFASLSLRENLWLAAYGRLREQAAAQARADELLDWLGWRHRQHETAAVLAHGERQWLEIAMVLAAEPSVVLLDEPTAGMSREESLRVAELIGELGASACVIVVEHDMEFVRALRVPVTVFHRGEVFASGSLDELRRDERILDIYLGRHDASAAA